MPYVITQGCCKDGACVSACPVQCIRPRPGDPEYSSAEQLYIDPEVCIECGVCAEVCPVDAIFPDRELSGAQSLFAPINAEHFTVFPIEDWSLAPRPAQRPAMSAPLSVAIVGTGPSAFYAAQELLEIPGVEVTFIEKLPTPFGLLRAGVAPDHLATKGMSSSFEQVLDSPRVRAFFNCEVGKDVSHSELAGTHHAVIYAHGASSDRSLGIPGEQLPGSHSAREFVSWYNGHPDSADQTFDFKGDRAVIVGNGNVALDVARSLVLAPEDHHGRGDMVSTAVEALAHSSISEVVIAARRGPVDAAYSTGELVSLMSLDDVDVVVEVDSDQVAAELDRVDDPDLEPRTRRGLRALLDTSQRESDPLRKRIVFRFFVSPERIDGDDHVEEITFRRTGVTAGTVSLSAGLILRAVGYRGAPLVDVPYDEARGVVPNEQGRVIDPASGSVLPGVFCAGWIKRGPTGVIGSNRTCSTETVERLIEDFTEGRLPTPVSELGALEDLVLRRRSDVHGRAGWWAIDAAEIHRGRESGRPREKFHTFDSLASAASGAEGGTRHGH